MRYKATVSYDGSSYSGWQAQNNAHGIQEEIEKALAKMHQHPVEITAAGRTDGGVHAIGQVFHFDSKMQLSSEHFTRALNSLLPITIRIQEVIPVSDTFHARFDCIGKRYDYLITNRKNDPFIQNRMKIDTAELDAAYMRSCAEVFIGTHDFTSFTSSRIDPRKPRIKTVTSIQILEEDGYLRIIFEGKAFLRYMVRMMAQTLIEAGKHRLSKEQIQQMLDAKDKHACRYKADACGLYLMEVRYGGDTSESELSYTYPSLHACSRQ